MKIVKCLIEMICEELDGAEHYVLSAIKWKSEYKRTADEFVKLAEIEMTHVKTLHAEVTRIIEEYRAKNGEPPAPMMAIYEYEHEKQIRKSAAIKQLIEEYKET